MPVSPSFSIAAGQKIQPPLGFIARGLSGDNPGGQWLYVVDAAAWIAPWTVGFSIPFAATQSPTVDATTAPINGSNTGTGASATISFTSELVPLNGGTSIVPSLATATLFTIGNAGTSNGSAIYTFNPVNDPLVGQYNILYLQAAVVSETGVQFPFEATIQDTTLPSFVVGQGAGNALYAPTAIELSVAPGQMPFTQTALNHLRGTFTFYGAAPGANAVHMGWQAALRPVSV